VIALTYVLQLVGFALFGWGLVIAARARRW
jgi:hypothetical protein